MYLIHAIYTLFEIDFKALCISRSSALNRIYGFLNSENIDNVVYVYLFKKTGRKTRENRGRREKGNDKMDGPV